MLTSFLHYLNLISNVDLKTSFENVNIYKLLYIQYLYNCKSANIYLKYYGLNCVS